METTTDNIALFIDYENIYDNRNESIEAVLNKLKENGRILIKRAYADWEEFKGGRREMLKLSIEPIELPAYETHGKNSADIRLVVDALEVALTVNYIDTIVIASNDRDFIPLIAKLRTLNKTVIVFASEKYTSPLLKGFCDEIYYYSNVTKVKPKVAVRSDIGKAYELLVHAINILSDKGTKCAGGIIKSTMKRIDPTFDEEEFGYNQFTKFLLEAQKNHIVLLTKDNTELIASIPENSDSSLKKLDSDVQSNALKQITGNKKFCDALGKVLGVVLECNQYHLPVNAQRLAIELKTIYPDFSYKALGFNQFKKFLQPAIEAGILILNKDMLYDDGLYVNSQQKDIKVHPYKLPLEDVIDFIARRVNDNAGYLIKSKHQEIFNALCKSLLELKDMNLSNSQVLEKTKSIMGTSSISPGEIARVYSFMKISGIVSSVTEEVDGQKRIHLKLRDDFFDRAKIVSAHNDCVKKQLEAYNMLQYINLDELEKILVV